MSCRVMQTGLIAATNVIVVNILQQIAASLSVACGILELRGTVKTVRMTEY